MTRRHRSWAVRACALLSVGAVLTATSSIALALFMNPLHTAGSATVVQAASAHDGAAELFEGQAYVEYVTRAEQTGRTDYYVRRNREPVSAEAIVRLRAMRGYVTTDLTLPRWARHIVMAPGVVRDGSSLEYEHGSVAAFGWPLRALKYEVAGSVGHFTSRRPPSGAVSGGVQITWLEPWQKPYGPLRFEHPRVLPLTPIWPGLLADTVFYAALCALPFVPGRLRRAIRRRRGRCPWCGYVLYGNAAACPECGR